MLGIPEPEFIRDLINRFASVKYFFFSNFNHLGLYVLSADDDTGHDCEGASKKYDALMDYWTEGRRRNVHP